MMAKAMRIHAYGGPEALRFEDLEVGTPGPGQVRIRHEAIGLNFLDTYYRSGLYKIADGFPAVLGSEAAGVVEAVGEGVADLKRGDRVAYTAQLGAYSTERLIDAGRVFKIPEGIDFRTAAAMTLKGLTAQYLLRRAFKVEKGHTVLIHAAAGGVGLIASQWAKALGATVIGTVGSDEKAALAKAHGCDHTINYRTENFVERVAAITGGAKCDVVYDSIGKDTYPGSLDCLKRFGTWVLFGQASGPIVNFDLALLAQKGCLYATRPTLFTYAAERADLMTMAKELTSMVESGKVRIEINQEFPLSEAAEAHRALEGRRTTGTTILIP